MNKSWKIALVVFISVLAGLLIGNRLAFLSFMQMENRAKIGFFGSNNNKLDEMFRIIGKEYVDSTDIASLTEDLSSELSNLLDPHTVYIPAKDLEAVNSELESSFSGIGVQFNIQNDTVMIVAVVSGGPSEKVGLLAGDRIIFVNDTSFVGKEISNERVMKKLRGAKNTQVKLGIVRTGTSETLYYTITRGDIPVNSVVASYMITPAIGFIRVDKFAANTYAEFLNALITLEKLGAKKYVIDLRENSGGLMDIAIAMANEFLPRGSNIVSAKGKAYPKFMAKADGKGSFIKQPLVVLIDDFSASASEIFAGAMQDNDRGTIIGRRSFGKGLVQQQFSLSDGSALRLTVARYYTPSGRSIQKAYENGKGKDYEMEVLNRFAHGEVDSADSIQQIDSLVYETLGGRKVYGGGGIMPDIFVPRDTLEYSVFLNKATNASYLYQFAFQFTDKNRDLLTKYKTWQEMQKFLDTQNLLGQFFQFTANKGLVASAKDINTSKNLINNLLQAYIIRNILGDKGFYPVFYQRDKAVSRAIEELE